MSALDDVIELAIDNTPIMRDDPNAVDEARAELELLRAERELYREGSWKLVEGIVAFSGSFVGCAHCGWQANSPRCVSVHPCLVARILRTDPDRARKMGLGWAL